MADLRVEGDEIKRLVKVARKAPVSLGFNPGTGDEDAWLGLHKTRSPDVLGKEAKAGAEGGKVTFGTATVAGKVMTLSCLRELPGVAKKLKKYLKSQKVLLNVVILDADGNVLESDVDEDLPEDPDLDDDNDLSAPEGNAAALERRIAALRDLLARMSPALAAGPLQALDKIAGFLAGGEVERTAAGLDKVEALVARLQQEAPPPDPTIARLAQAAAQIRAQVEGLGDERTRTTLLAALGRVADLLRAGDAEAALALLKKLQDVLRGAASGTGSVRPVAKVLPLWADAREATGVQIGQLQGHLQDSGLPLFERIADKGLHGVTEGQLVAMQVALMTYDAAAPPAREAALTRLRAAVAAMRAFLASNPVLPLLETNPFGVEVTVRDTLSGALDAIDTAIAA